MLGLIIVLMLAAAWVTSHCAVRHAKRVHAAADRARLSALLAQRQNAVASARNDKARLSAEQQLKEALAVAELFRRVPNFDQVADRFWRGAAPAIAEIELLKNHRVDVIIDLRLGGPKVRRQREAVERMGVTYIHFPMTYLRPSQEKIADFLELLESCLARGLRVYLHCIEGADRTGTMVGEYRIQRQGWSFARAYKEMRAHYFKRFWFTLRGAVKESARLAHPADQEAAPH